MMLFVKILCILVGGLFSLWCLSCGVVGIAVLVSMCREAKEEAREFLESGRG